MRKTNNSTACKTCSTVIIAECEMSQDCEQVRYIDSIPYGCNISRV